MATIADLLAAGRTYSFEFFPPQERRRARPLVESLMELQPLRPSFVSVTYRGGRSSRQRTHDLVVGMLRTTTLTPMAHLICVAHTRLELAEILVEFRKAGVQNLMALGGDPPTDPDAGEGELRHAIELVELARAIGGFSIGVAAHPAGHPRSPDMKSDRDLPGREAAAGGLRGHPVLLQGGGVPGARRGPGGPGPLTPVVPGIMPVTSLSSIGRMAEMGAAVPADLAARAGSGRRPGSVRKAGTDLATRLCQDLLDAGAPGCTSIRSIVRW
jgi:methylenetetrahydrofolate reductase (NADPH)